MLLVLEFNIVIVIMRDVFEKVVKCKLGVIDFVIMQGLNFLYELGEDIEEDMVVYYVIFLDKVLVYNFLLYIICGLFCGLSR